MIAFFRSRLEGDLTITVIPHHTAREKCIRPWRSSTLRLYLAQRLLHHNP